MASEDYDRMDKPGALPEGQNEDLPAKSAAEKALTPAEKAQKTIVLAPVRHEKGHRDSGSRSFRLVTIACIAISCVLAVASVFLFRGVLRTGTEALKEQYEDAYDTERQEVYDTWFDKFKERAEAKYHVTSRVSISIGSVREVGSLEVLQVTDEEYILEDAEDNDANSTVWLKAYGSGTFNVDLEAAEFLVDDDRAYVLVRIPEPTLENVDITGIQELLFENENFIGNGTYTQGEDLALKLSNEATSLVEKEFTSNEYYFRSAESSAKSSIECLVRELNPDVENLTVEVEFM